MRVFRTGKFWLAALAVVMVVGLACSSATADKIDTPEPQPEPTATTQPTAIPEPTSTPTPEPSPSPEPTATPEPTGELTLHGFPAPEFTPGPEPSVNPSLRFMDPFRRYAWQTDFSKFSIDYNDIIAGGPPRDGIASIDNPKFLSVAADPDWLGLQEPVISLEINGDARAYPLQILTQHEIVNDVVGDVPVVVTFCPLCNTAIAFERTVHDQVFEFGVSGLLRFSDLIMYDRTTETWWQQITGAGIVGELTGFHLTQLPASIVSWQSFKDNFPEGQVLSRDTGFTRNYGKNPYPGYDNINESPFLFFGPDDGRLKAMERVTSVALNGDAAAYPFLELEKQPVVNDSVGGTPIVVFFSKGTTSALDSSSFDSARDIGSGVVYRRTVDGQELTFAANEEGFVDDQTGTTWNLLGQAIDGPMEGKSLEPVIHANHFWFAWAAFKPDTRVWRAEA